MKVLYTLSEVEERRIKMAREKLRKYRQSIGKTQEEMAEIWGITLSFYYKIESGEKNPSIQNLREFKKRFFNADVEEIFLE